MNCGFLNENSGGNRGAAAERVKIMFTAKVL
jgi:hypothetical protein